ncbi:MAG: hypothetical protein ACTSVY_16110 [Candidatus Helarchaeota archaeon]
MSNEKSDRKTFLDRIFDMAASAIDSFNEIIGRVQDRVLNLVDNMESRLQEQAKEEDTELKNYMKVSISDLDEKAGKNSEILIKTTSSIESDGIEPNQPVARYIKVEDILKNDEQKETHFSEDDIKKLILIYGVDREKAKKLIENNILSVYKLASEVPSKISSILGISVVEAQNIIRAASALVF